MGGAIGIVFARIMKNLGYKIKTVITFGSPRVTDLRGAKTLQKVTAQNVLHQEAILYFFEELGLYRFSHRANI